MKYRFGDYELDDRTVELTHAGARVDLEPLVFQLLLVLLQHRDRVVTKDELLASVWAGKVVSEATLTNAVKLARQAVGDSGDTQSVIRTARGHGYRFVADAGVTSDPVIVLAGADRGALPASDLPVLPDAPSVAVLGFDDVGPATPDDVFSDGLAIDLNTHLARLHGLFVIAHESARRFSLAREPADEVGRRLGVRYLVHGTVRRVNRRIRLSVNLTEVTRQEVLWSETFDRVIDDVFAIQDEIVSNIVSALLPEIERAEMDRARLVTTENLNAWECYYRAMWHNFRFTADDSVKAQALLLRASELDPDFGRAHAGLSFNHFLHAFLDTGGDSGHHVRLALQHAQHSVSLDDRDAMSHWVLGRALFLSRQHDEALRALDRAMLANPNYAQGRYARGFVGVHAGQEKGALQDLDVAQRLSPFDPLLFAMKSSRAISLAVQGQYDAAAHWAVLAAESPNAHFHIQAIAGACLALAGEPERARHAIDHVRTIHPGYSVAIFERSFPHQQAEHARLFRRAFKVAALPES